jgi:hypothetical protein
VSIFDVCTSMIDVVPVELGSSSFLFMGGLRVFYIGESERASELITPICKDVIVMNWLSQRYPQYLESTLEEVTRGIDW